MYIISYNYIDLSVGVNWFGDQGAIKLASNLKLIPNLEKLNLCTKFFIIL